MADLCRSCTAAYMGVSDWSDFPPVAGWYLCEGCGFHAFDPEGRRLCDEGKGSAPDEEDEVPTFDEPCFLCVAETNAPKRPEQG